MLKVLQKKEKEKLAADANRFWEAEEARIKESVAIKVHQVQIRDALEKSGFVFSPDSFVKLFEWSSIELHDFEKFFDFAGIPEGRFVLENDEIVFESEKFNGRIQLAEDLLAVYGDNSFKKWIHKKKDSSRYSFSIIQYAEEGVEVVYPSEVNRANGFFPKYAFVSGNKRIEITSYDPTFIFERDESFEEKMLISKTERVRFEIIRNRFPYIVTFSVTNRVGKLFEIYTYNGDEISSFENNSFLFNYKRDEKTLTVTADKVIVSGMTADEAKQILKGYADLL